jgi:hypothetical protein
LGVRSETTSYTYKNIANSRNEVFETIDWILFVRQESEEKTKGRIVTKCNTKRIRKIKLHRTYRRQENYHTGNQTQGED